MKLSIASVILVSLTSTTAFAPVGPGAFVARGNVGTTHLSAVDPSFFHDVPQHVDSLRDAFSSISLADVDADAVTSAVSTVSDAVSTPEATDAVSDATAATGNGWFGFLTGPIEGLLSLIHSALVGVGMPTNTWGVSIVAMTILIKIATFPLTKTQLESTNKMQALQPTIKDIQSRYQSNPEVMNQKIAEVYQANEVNPLAGCFPSLVQIPVFIGLYRAVLTLARENQLDEPFLWLPNLEGPTYGADPAHGSDWILSGWVDGAPSLGWPDTIAFLSIPIFLVISQFVSMELMQTKDQQQQGNFILKLLPLMIGWFSLNVPAALGIYWVANNIITTATTLLVRSQMKTEPIAPSSSGATAAQPSVFTPPRKKPSGFGGAETVEGVKPITPIVDAEVMSVSKEIVDNEVDVDDSVAEGTGMESPKPKKNRSKKKKKRRN